MRFSDRVLFALVAIVLFLAFVETFRSIRIATLEEEKASLERQLEDRDLVRGEYYNFRDSSGHPIYFHIDYKSEASTPAYLMVDAGGHIIGRITTSPH